MEDMPFVVACKKFFGMHPGQTLPEFTHEIKALTEQDREDLRLMFLTVGIKTPQRI